MAGLAHRPPPFFAAPHFGWLTPSCLLSPDHTDAGSVSLAIQTGKAHTGAQQGTRLRRARASRAFQQVSRVGVGGRNMPVHE